MKKKLSLIMAICLCICSVWFVPMKDNTAYAASIRLNKTAATVVNGKTVQLKVKGTTAKAKWSSSKTSVATVTSKGLVKTKKPGTATITAKVGKKILKCKVTVKRNIYDSKQVLKQYILKNGEIDEYGRYYITLTSSETDLTANEVKIIYYDECFDYYCYCDTDDFDYSVCITTYEYYNKADFVIDASYQKPHVTEPSSFIAFVSYDPRKYSSIDENDFEIVSCENDIEESARTYFYGCMEVSLVSYNEMLDAIGLNMTVRNLGFTTFGIE